MLAFVYCYAAQTRKSDMEQRGQPLQPARAGATEFEAQVRQLRITKQPCADSRELRRWCERNRNRCYIPEWLLKSWEMPVDVDSS
jgi:hypothetical protein